MDLTQKKCRPCEGGIPKLTLDEAKKLLPQVPSWELEENLLRKNFKFKNFREAMKFVNRMAEIADGENHHPDFTVHFNRVEVEIWTHAVGGLSENDFILAAKLDQLNADG